MAEAIKAFGLLWPCKCHPSLKSELYNCAEAVVANRFSSNAPRDRLASSQISRRHGCFSEARGFGPTSEHYDAPTVYGHRVMETTAASRIHQYQ